MQAFLTMLRPACPESFAAFSDAIKSMFPKIIKHKAVTLPPGVKYRVGRGISYADNVARGRFFSQHGMTFVAPRKKSLEMPSIPVLFESEFLVIHIFKC
ncbi:hypothetical protein [Agrobacterium sp. V1]|uniref:hypothetical protein n=1 Tax=Agrobacterium sp. V1 TaxID=3061957 RepID=UPI002671D059|nr:hypothetical protein [Agrobacterium sp. V1]MDO3443802.1 hypothetical protein [Agrobacterium sp. V1]